MPKWTSIKKIIADKCGGTAIEYGLIVALIALASFGALGSVANENTSYWGLIGEQVRQNMPY